MSHCEMGAKQCEMLQMGVNDHKMGGGKMP